MKDELKFLQDLHERGVRFYIEVPMEYGISTDILTPNEVLKFIKDPVATYAAHRGVSKADYLAWQRDDCSARCSAKTELGGCSAMELYLSLAVLVFGLAILGLQIGLMFKVGKG